MPILNYTTKIESTKTIGEIQEILVRQGARKIEMDYDKDGNPISIFFTVEITPGNRVRFKLFCNHESVMKVMERDKKIPRSMITKAQALRVSWRIQKDWVEAQMAIIEAELVSLVQVYLPYAVTNTGDTVFEMVTKKPELLLGDGK